MVGHNSLSRQSSVGSCHHQKCLGVWSETLVPEIKMNKSRSSLGCSCVPLEQSRLGYVSVPSGERVFVLGLAVVWAFTKPLPSAQSCPEADGLYAGSPRGLPGAKRGCGGV